MSKNKNLIIISAAIMVAGITIIWLCRDGSGTTPTFLPGIYVCTIKNDFCRVDDTLTIRRAQLGEDNYTVTRMTSFTRVRKDREESPEFERQYWTAAYQSRQLMLVSSNSANNIGYSPLRNMLNKGDFYYEKIE